MAPSDLEITATAPARRILKAARAMGLVCRYDRSALSEAEYLRVSDGEDEVKIRLATHDARPTYQSMYGAADFEVTKSGKARMGAHGDEWEAVEYLARKFRRELPAFARAEHRRARQDSAAKAADTRNRNKKEHELDLAQQILSQLRDLKVAKAPNLTKLVHDYQISTQAARRIQGVLKRYLGVTSVEVRHRPVTMADRPSGRMRAEWQADFVAKPWEVIVTYQRGKKVIHRTSTQEEAEALAQEYRDGK